MDDGNHECLCNALVLLCNFHYDKRSIQNIHWHLSLLHYAYIPVSIEEVDPSEPPCEVKPLKSQNIDMPASDSKPEQLEKCGQTTAHDSGGDSSGHDVSDRSAIDFSGESGDEYTDSVFEIARLVNNI